MKNIFVSLVHTFLVSRLIRCSYGILSTDFLQRLGAEISLNAQLLQIDRYTFPLKSQGTEDQTVQLLITAGQKEPSSLGREEGVGELVGDWGGYRRARGGYDSTPSLCENSPVSGLQT
jgi:hypothetical protein